METGHAHWRSSFLMDQIVLAFIVEGHSVTISTISFLILTTGYRGDDFQS